MRNRVGQFTRQFANIDRVEILKGPSGVEFGVGEPGGFVNYVTKRPLGHFLRYDTSWWLLSGFSVGAGVS